MSLTPEAEAALKDLYLFLDKKEKGGFWNLDLREQPHREIVNAIQYAEEHDATPGVMVIVPRGTFKTSIARGAVAWKLLRQIFLFDNPYHRIGLASATLRLGRDALRLIEGQFRYNKRLIEHYGQLWKVARRGSMGSKVEDGIVLAPRIDRGELASCPEPNLWIASEKKVSTGAHCDELYVDDLMDEKSVATPDRLAKTIDVWRLLQPLLNPTDRAGRPARRTMTATRWHDADVPGMVMKEMEDRGKRNWLVIQRGAYTEVGAEEGPLYFPDVLTREFLESQKIDLGPVRFSSNYLNDPIGKKGFIPEELIKFAPRKTFPELRWMRISIDPNAHGEAKRAGDYAAILVSGSDRWGKLYVVDAFGSREWSPTQFLDVLFDLHGTYPDVPFYIEDEHAAYLEHSITLEESIRSDKAGHRVKLKINWIPTARNKTKYERWDGIYPRFARNQILFAEEIDYETKAEIKSELVRGSASRHDDFLDALAMSETGRRPKTDSTGKSVEIRPDGSVRPSRRVTYADIPELAGLLAERPN